MGYGTRNNGQITTFWPDDTEDEFFMQGAQVLGEILHHAANKWPGITFDKIVVDPCYIHTDCLTYDRYDSGDYTYFLRISKLTS